MVEVNILDKEDKNSENINVIIPEKFNISNEPRINLNPILGFGRTYFKKNIWNIMFSLTNKKNIGSRLFKILFDYYKQYKNKEDFKFLITKEYFESQEKWEIYFERNKTYKEIFKEERSLEFGLEFLDSFKDIIKESFDLFIDSNKKNNPSDLGIGEAMNDFDVGDKISGFNSLSEFIEINPKLKNEFKKYNNDNLDCYIPKKILADTDFAEFVLKLSPNTPKILLNPLIKNIKQNNISDIENVIKTKLRIRNKLIIENTQSIKGSYIYTCPKCAKKIIYKPYEMGSTTVKHFNCPTYPKSNGKFGNVPILKSSYINGSTLPLYCYEVMCYIDEYKLEEENKYFFSLDGNIINGEYYVNLVNIPGNLMSPDDKDIKTIILGVERATAKILPGFLSEEEGKKLANSFGIGNHKLFDIWSGIIKYYKNEKNITLKPDKGSLLQIFLIISALSRELFNYRNFPILVIGDTSISKTYPAKLIGKLLDINYKFTSGKQSQTYAGIYGGINTDIAVGAKKYKIFQEGAAGAGLTIFDEGSHFFDMEKPFNEELKSLHNDEIEIMKIGGKIIQQRFTPLIFFNFTNYHKGNIDKFKDMSYEGEIKFYYWKLIKSFDTNEFHENNKLEADFYLNNKNLYLPLQYYDNEDLREAIAIVRQNKHSKDICWWSGGSIPAQNRFLFDCVVKRDLNFIREKAFDLIENIEAQNIYDLPTIDFVGTINNYCLNNKKINLKNILNNDENVTKQLEELKNNVISFLRKNEAIIVHFSDSKKLDEKLSSSIVMFFTVLQLLNDSNATDLDEVTKDFGNKILLKCKIGLTEIQYNFLDNSYIPNKEIIDNKKYTNTALQYKTEQIIEEEQETKVEEKIVEALEKKELESKLNKSDIKKSNEDIEEIDGDLI